METDSTNTAISPIVRDCLLRGLAAALPTSDEATLQAAREMVVSLQPRTAMEAASAVRAVVAHFASIAMYERAAQPGVSEANAMHLYANANACSRTSDAAQRCLLKRPATASPPTEQPVEPTQPVERSPTPPPAPEADSFQPHDRFGKPIPLWRYDLMTKAQLDASLAYPREPELERVALAEEAAMLAEQAALDANQHETAEAD